jgi:hypothetical protein
MPSQKRQLEDARKRLGIDQGDEPPGTVASAIIMDCRRITRQIFLDEEGHAIGNPRILPTPPQTPESEDRFMLDMAQLQVNLKSSDTVVHALERLADHPCGWSGWEIDTPVVCQRLIQRLSGRGTVGITLTSDKA